MVTLVKKDQEKEPPTDGERLAPGRKRPRLSHVIVFFAVGLWILVMLDCFSSIYPNQSAELGPITVGTRAEDDTGFDSFTPWGGSKTWYLHVRHVYIRYQ